MCTAWAPTAKWAAKARTPRSAPGSNAQRGAARGFTLIELVVVMALIAIASGLMSLALRDPAGTQLEHEAARLVSLFESARAESRASGVAVRWVPRVDPEADADFSFVGVSHMRDFPRHWLAPDVSAQIIGTGSVLLGPEPFLPPQRVVLSLRDHRLALGTNGLEPFAVVGDDASQTP